MGAMCTSTDPSDPSIKSNLRHLNADQLKARYEAAGQGHVFQMHSDLDPEMKGRLEQQANLFDPM